MNQPAGLVFILFLSFTILKYLDGGDFTAFIFGKHKMAEKQSFILSIVLNECQGPSLSTQMLGYSL